MLFSTIGQIHVFLWMIGAGLSIGALYAFCAWLRRLLCAGFWLTLIIDILFGLTAAVVLIVTVLLADHGRFRLYELLGAALGAILFELGIHPAVGALTAAIWQGIRGFFQKITKFRLIKVIFR